VFANRFTAIVDACVLVGVAKRNLLLSLAGAELFRARWSDEILEETRLALTRLFSSRIGIDEPGPRADAAIAAMMTAFPESAVTDYEKTRDTRDTLSCLPDAKDHHVLAAAIHCKASVIVTDNL